MFGRGLELNTGATGRIARVRVEANHSAGVHVDGATVEASDLDIVGTLRTLADGRSGRGLAVQDDGEVVVERARLAGNADSAVHVGGPGATLRGTDLVIRETGDEPGELRAGRGVNVELGGSAELRRVRIEDSGQLGVAAIGGPEQQQVALLVEDLEVRRTLGLVDGFFGRGLEVGDSADVTVRRALFDANRDTGVYAKGASTITLEDITVRNTESRVAGQAFGRGIDVGRGAAVTARRVALVGNTEVGFAAFGEDTRVSLEDARIAQTRGRPLDGLFGRGMEVLEGARVTGRRLEVVENRSAGVTVGDTGTEMSLREVRIEDTTETLCADSSCPERSLGMGAVARAGARLSLEAFVVRRAALCGVQLEAGGELDLTEGRVEDNPIGACIQADGYDETRLTNGVQYAGNDRNADLTQLPVPEASAPATSAAGDP
jgi:hypothetical protein